MLKASAVASDGSIGVDRETNVINGYVVAQEGRFKSEGRGQFTTDSLMKLVELGNEAPNGIRARFGHPNQSDDGLGKYLGRAKNFQFDAGKVRADLHLNPTSLETPPQGGRAFGDYVMSLAESDPGAFSSSIVVAAEREEIEGQPPVWHPTHLYASDVVDTGDAVDDFLSADFLEGLPSGDVYMATKLIDEKFEGQPREVVEARLRAFCDKYLCHKFGEVEVLKPESEDDEMPVENDARIKQLEEQNAATSAQLTSLNETLASMSAHLQADREASKAREASSERAKHITALCAQCRIDAVQANEWIADEAMSVEGVKDLLLAKKFEENTPAGDGGGTTEPTGDAKYIAEFKAQQDVHRKLGVSQDEYVQLRKEEDGKADSAEEFEYMSPEWAAKYCEEIAS